MQTFFEKNPSPSYTNHKFIATPLDRLGIKQTILRPFKWFFSAYGNYTPDRINRTQRAFKKLLLVSEVPDNETDQFKTFEEEIKKQAPKKPWFSDAYKGCLYLSGRCIFNRYDTKVSPVLLILIIRTCCSRVYTGCPKKPGTSINNYVLLKLEFSYYSA